MGADVALAADPDRHPYEIIRQDEYQTTGGTTAAAAAWAGYLALVNQCRVKMNMPKLGFVNPHLYRLGVAQQQQQRSSGSDSSSGGVFRDVTKGSNGGYQAGVGWDAATGWGSMNGRKLLEALCPGFVSRPALMMF